jgi:hypothetical protein
MSGISLTLTKRMDVRIVVQSSVNGAKSPELLPFGGLQVYTQTGRMLPNTLQRESISNITLKLLLQYLILD